MSDASREATCDEGIEDAEHQIAAILAGDLVPALRPSGRLVSLLSALGEALV